MATHYITVGEYPDLTAKKLSQLLTAFKLLHIDPDNKQNRHTRVEITVNGTWMVDGDGLFLNWNTGEVYSIGRTTMWVKWEEYALNGERVTRRKRLPIKGFTQFMFITMP